MTCGSVIVCWWARCVFSFLLSDWSREQYLLDFSVSLKHSSAFFIMVFPQSISEIFLDDENNNNTFYFKTQSLKAFFVMVLLKRK